MLKSCSRVNHITGETGQSSGEGTACTYGVSAALELSNGSNGWFRFILDGKLATMYSSGSPEGGSDSSGSFSSVQI